MGERGEGKESLQLYMPLLVRSYRCFYQLLLFTIHLQLSRLFRTLLQTGILLWEQGSMYRTLQNKEVAPQEVLRWDVQSA